VKRLFSEVDELDDIVTVERAALARNRIKLEFGILSHSCHARIGEAYLTALVDNLPEPFGARIKKRGRRDKIDQEIFKNLVRNAYTSQKSILEYDNVSSMKMA
jgi:hypothetical protein